MGKAYLNFSEVRIEESNWTYQGGRFEMVRLWWKLVSYFSIWFLL